MSGLRRTLVILGVLAAPGIAFGEGPRAPHASAHADAPAKASAKIARSKTRARAHGKAVTHGRSKKRAPARPRRIAASRGWHTAPEGKSAPLDENGRPKLVLQGLNIPDRVELTARSDAGGFSAEDLDRAAHVMREPSTGNEHPIDPRLIDFIYGVAVHFKVPEVRVLSGYRTPRRHSTSNHGKGRAMDCVFPGVRDEDVAKHAREHGFVGVGVYPVSGFLHLDVRERSFFWIDTSGPGKRSRLRGILGGLATKSDKEAAARGDRSVGPFVIATDVDELIASRAAAAAAAQRHDQTESQDADDEDDDDESAALP
jgi:uncharacterized protein YcbK (DUF882 family)